MNREIKIKLDIEFQGNTYSKRTIISNDDNFTEKNFKETLNLLANASFYGFLKEWQKKNQDNTSKK